MGKAKSLRSRVRSYFQDSSSDVRAFIPFLRKLAVDLDTIVTLTEKEAAILENSLIKEQKPRFNVKLRDDKEFLSLRLSTEHAWPRLELVRKPKPDEARYYGPYHSATAARRTLHLVEKHFQLRTCSDREIESRKRPCLKFQIKRCPAPCVYDVDPAEYAAQVHSVSLFLDGRHDELTRELKARMRAASDHLEFEVAAVTRDQLSAVESIRQSQRVVSVTDEDQDVLGLYREGDLVELSVMLVRAGRVIDVASFSNRRVEVPDDEVVAAFLRDHYGEGGSGEALIPEEIIVPVLRRAPTACKSGWPNGARRWCADGTRSVSCSRPRAARAKRCSTWRPRTRATPSKRSGAQRRTSTNACSRCRSGCACRRYRGASSAVTSRTWADKTRWARSSRCSTAYPTRSATRTYKVRSAGDGDDYRAMFEVLGRRFRRGRDAAQRAALMAEGAEGSEAESASEAALEPSDAAEAKDANDATDCNCRICSWSTAVAVSSASRSPPRTTSACMICPSVAWPKRRRTCWATNSSIACTCPGKKIPSRSVRIARSCSCWHARATRRTASPTADARRSARSGAWLGARSSAGHRPQDARRAAEDFGLAERSACSHGRGDPRGAGCEQEALERTQEMVRRQQRRRTSFVVRASFFRIDVRRSQNRSLLRRGSPSALRLLSWRVRSVRHPSC